MRKRLTRLWPSKLWPELIGLILLCLGCTPSPPAPTSSSPMPTATPTLKLESSAFSPDGFIPAAYTCDGANRSPALKWDAPPLQTKSQVVMVDDPDAPGRVFVHWVLYDLPPAVRQLPEGMAVQPLLPTGGTQGKSDFGAYGYGGPCPPKLGLPNTHRYRFRLYALDTVLDLPPGATQAQVATAMEGHVAASGELIGRYRRT